MKRLFPLVMADIALFTIIDHRLRVLLVQRSNEPAHKAWALPGGLLRPELDLSLDDTAKRVLASKVRVDVRRLDQVATMSGPTRDPRGWSVSTLYLALLPSDQVPAVAGDKTEAVAWRDPVRPGAALAFDHGYLMSIALLKLREKVEGKSLPLQLMPEKFTLTDVQRACEAILGRAIDKGAFRRQVKGEKSLIELPGEFLRGAQRPAQLYTKAEQYRF